MDLKREPFVSGFGFLEAPRWRHPLLWVSDMALHRVLAFDTHGRLRQELETPDRPSGLGWLPGGELLVVAMDAQQVLRRREEGWAVHADLRIAVEGALNDMVVSKSGHAYVTGFGYDPQVEDQKPTSLVHVSPDGSSEVQSDTVWVPNGCVITPDERQLIVAETRRHRLIEFSITDSGNLRDPRVFGVLPSGSWSDGICLDVEGAVWVADPKAKRCVRMARSGEVLAVIDTAPKPSIACTLGGDDGRSLFILLSELGEMASLKLQLQACIEIARVDVPGTCSP
jgi:sugar lactone lactonase YvrE